MKIKIITSFRSSNRKLLKKEAIGNYIIFCKNKYHHTEKDLITIDKF